MYGLNFSFKILFLEYLEKNIRNLSLGSLSFVLCRLNVYRSTLVLRNLSYSLHTWGNISLKENLLIDKTESDRTI